MKNSDTPKTDAVAHRRSDDKGIVALSLHAVGPSGKDFISEEVVPADFARQLERDFYDAMSGAEKLYKKLKATPPEELLPKCCYGWPMKPTCIETCPHATEEAKKLLMHRLSYPATPSPQREKNA